MLSLPHSGPRDASGPARWFLREAWTLTPRGGSARVVALTAAITVVGRDPSAGLVIEHESVSRQHARLDREEERLFITDLKSAMGTHLNGDPVLRAPVRSGDTLTFGAVAYRVDRRSVPHRGRIMALAGALLAIALLAWAVLRTLPVQP